MMMRSDYYKLMLVTNKGKQEIAQYLKFIETCARAGITSVQLREKSLNKAEILEFAYELRPLLKRHNIPLIVNDDLEIALASSADGLHLGQDDSDPIRARQLLGDDKLIGISVDNIDNLRTANYLPIDYVGIGAIFPSKSKADITTIWGVEGLAELAPLTQLPIIAIGGINESNVTQVVAAGANGVAVISALHQAENVDSVIKVMLQTIENHAKNH